MAASPFTLLGFPNYVASSITTVGAFNVSSPIPAGYEASYLKTEEPSDVARITSILPIFSGWMATINSATAVTIDGLVLVNSNISPNGYYRFTSPTQAPIYNGLTPSSIVSSTNLTGTVTNIDEPINSLDGLFIGPSNTALDWNALLAFGTPSSNPATGTARGHFVVACQLFGTPTSIYPRLNAELWKSGSKVADLGWRAVTSATAANGIYIFPFDPATLSSPTGANCQIKVFGEYGDNSSYFKIDCVNLYFESTAGGAVAANDSGWIASPTGNYSSGDNSIQPQVNLQYFPTTAWTISSGFQVSALIVDDQVDHNPNIGSGGHGVPIVSLSLTSYATGYVQAGVFAAGTAVSLQTGVVRPGNPSIGVVTQGVSGTTLGGQTYGADLWKRRTIPGMNMVVTRDEGYTILNSIMWLKGNSGAFYVSFDKTLSAKYQIFSGAWVTVRDTGGCVMTPLQPGVYTTDGTMLHNLSFPACDEKV